MRIGCSAMSGSVTHWEKQRSAWLMARTRPDTSGRRRAEMLSRRARRLSRGGSGVAETSLQEDVTPALFRRMLTSNDGAGEQLARLVFVPALFVLLGVLLGPAMAIATGLYYLSWWKAPKIGRLWVWPWLAAGTLSIVVGGFIRSIIDPAPAAWLVAWPPTLHVYLPVLVPTWLWVQFSLGLLLTGWFIRAHGWAAVPKGSAPKPEKDKDGEWIQTPEDAKVRLDPHAGEGVTSQPGSETPEVIPKLALSAHISHSDDAGAEPDVEDEPVFGDEDAGLDEEVEIWERSTS